MLDDLIQGEPSIQVLFRGEPHLRVHDAVLGQVFRALTGYTKESLRRLHDRDGVSEGLQVPLERTAVGSVPKPLTQSRTVLRRQAVVSALVGQFQHGLRPKSAVEMVVQ